MYWRRPQTCLQVREIKYDNKGIKTQVDKDWTLFYDQIEGYQHRDDQRVIIRVKRYERKTLRLISQNMLMCMI